MNLQYPHDLEKEELKDFINMGKTVDFLSRTFVQEEVLTKAIKQIGEKLNLELTNDSNYTLSFYNSEINNALKVDVLSELKFNELKEDDVYLSGYGNRFYILIFGQEDQISVPFMREVLALFPEMIVYIEEHISSEKLGQDYITYTKNQLDQFEGDSFYALVDKLPPSDLA